MMLGGVGPLGQLALACALLAAAMQVFFLLRKPALAPTTKLFLLVALGPLPVAAAVAGNVSNLEVTKERKFCGSCHVMHPFTRDAARSTSLTLASAHSRNDAFGAESCYVCHADYEMFGTVTTKLSGMRHVWNYYVGGWREAPPEKRPTIRRPFPNSSCTHCHAEERPHFRRRLEHAVHAEAFERGAVRCASSQCHGPAHPAGGTAR